MQRALLCCNALIHRPAPALVEQERVRRELELAAEIQRSLLLDETALLTRLDTEGEVQLAPIKLPEIMSCLRIRQMTPFGNMHV